jgi:hypothetical protein
VCEIASAALSLLKYDTVDDDHDHCDDHDADDAALRR